MPAPAYYAHLVASRSRFHLNDIDVERYMRRIFILKIMILSIIDVNTYIGLYFYESLLYLIYLLYNVFNLYTILILTFITLFDKMVILNISYFNKHLILYLLIFICKMLNSSPNIRSDSPS